MPRPEETEFNNATASQGTSIIQEGSAEQENKQYIKPLPTELEIARTFTVPGTRYSLKMTAENMHNPDDFLEAIWEIECANPVIPDDWDVVFAPFQHVTPYFNISFRVNKPGVRLPTKPIIRLIKLHGEQR